MQTALLELEPMAQPRKSGRPKGEPTVTVRIEQDVYDKAVQVSGMKKMDLGKYVSQALRPVVERELKAEAKKILGEK